MRIDVKVDNSQILLRMRNGQKRLAYAVANAINTTLREIQQAERAEVTDGDGDFTIRKSDFILRNVAVIKPFASAKLGRPFGEIAVGQKPRLLLSTFEKGGDRPPFTPGAKHVAVPVKGSPARPTFRSSVPAELTFKALKFRKTRVLPGAGLTKAGRQRRTRKKAGGILYGEQGTYLIPNVGVFQRKGTGRSRRLLYAFRSKIRLRPRLRFTATARRVTDRSFAANMEAEVVKTLNFSGGRR